MHTELPRHPDISEVANYLNVSARTVRRLISRGELKAHRIGPRLLRVDRKSVLEMVGA